MVLPVVAALALPMSLGTGSEAPPDALGAAPAPMMIKPFAADRSWSAGPYSPARPFAPAGALSSPGPFPASPSADAPTPIAPTIPPPTAAPPTTAPPPAVFTIAASGDFLAHRPVVARAAVYGRASGQAYDFGPMLAAIEPIMSGADLAICHLETPLSPDARDLSGYPVFNVPGELASAIAASGYDACSVASNHALDRGPAGVAATLDVLDAAGVAHAGTARTPAEADAATAAQRLVKGVTVAHLSYTYGLNGFEVPANQPWLVNLIDADRILDDARKARAAGARFVVVSMHWGAEYRTDPTADQRALAARLLSSPDVDLLLGHHAHVVQPIEKIGDKYVAYGMGNLLSNQTASCCPADSQDGVVVLVTIEVGDATASVTRVTYHPTWVEAGTYRVLPVARALDDPATTGVRRAELERSWNRTVAAVSALGGDAHGVVPEEVPQGAR